jgi:hypothetical protein
VQRYVKLQARYNALCAEVGRTATMEEFALHVGTSNVAGLATVMRSGEQCKNAMVSANLRLVVSVAKKFSGPNCSVPLSVLPILPMRCLPVWRFCACNRSLVCSV